MRRVTNLHRLHDFLSTVIVYAPDRFPSREYLGPADQLTLEGAFEELRYGLRFVRPTTDELGTLRHLRELLVGALAAYRAGDDVRGAHLLQDFESIVFSGQGDSG